MLQPYRACDQRAFQQCSMLVQCFNFVEKRKLVCTVCALWSCLLGDWIVTTHLLYLVLNRESWKIFVVACFQVVVLSKKVFIFHLECWNGPYVAVVLEWSMFSLLVLQTVPSEFIILWVYCLICFDFGKNTSPRDGCWVKCTTEKLAQEMLVYTLLHRSGIHKMVSLTFEMLLSDYQKKKKKKLWPSEL